MMEKRKNNPHPNLNMNMNTNINTINIDTNVNPVRNLSYEFLPNTKNFNVSRGRQRDHGSLRDPGMFMYVQCIIYVLYCL